MLTTWEFNVIKSRLY